MKRSFVFVLILAALASVIHAVPVTDEDRKESRPVMLLFELKAGEGARKDVAKAATVSVRKYLRNTEKVDVILFDRESPIVERAVVQKALTEEQITTYAAREDRINVAVALQFDYACAGDITIDGNNIKINLWGGKPGEKAKDKPLIWEGVGSSSASGTGDNGIANAVESAASMAVLDMANKAFGGLVRIPSKDALAQDNSDAITPAVDSGDSVGDLFAKGDEAAAAGNTAVAIDYYKQVINKAPNNFEARLKLADIFIKRGYNDEAKDEINRAEALGADPKECERLRNKIAGIDAVAGGTDPQQQPAPDATKPDKPIQTRTFTYPNDSKILEGDRLWNEKATDKALAAYREAAKITPSDYRPYERMAMLYASVGKFGECVQTLAALNKADPYPPENDLANRYRVFSLTFDKHFESAMKKYNSSFNAYADGSSTRESYYNTLRSLSTRLTQMASFADSMPAPAYAQAVNAKRGSAATFLAQAVSSVLLYLETGDSAQTENADVFASQAYVLFTTKDK